MKRFVTFFCVFVAMGVWNKAAAQFNVTLNVDPNPTPKILEWSLNPQTVNLTVTNLTSNTERYKIKAQLYKDNELVGETRTEASPLRTIEANSVEVYFAEDVVPEGATKLYGNIDKIVIKTGKIPAGTYRLCTKLVDESGTLDLTTDYCQTFFVSSYQQPRLILPLEGSSVPYTGATSSLNFQWSPVLPQPRFPVYYQVRVVPKMVGQTALYAFRYNTPVINEKVAGSTNFIWSVNSLEIEPERDYVWGVIAMDDDEKAIGENEGLSEIWEFRFVEPSTTTVKIINNLQAPKLIYPSDKKILNKNINQINFTWTGLKPIQNSGVNYEFRLVEKPDNNTALHWFNYGTPLISQVILNDTFLSVNILNNNIDKDKEYVWGVIPKDPHNGNDFIQNAGYLDKFVFSFGTENLPQLTKFDFKQSFPRLSSDKSHALITIDIADDALSFNDNYLIKPYKYEILPMANEPLLELYDVDTSHFHPDYHAFKLKKISAAPNSPLNLMEDLSGTYNIKYQYHVLKRESFRLDTIALRDTTLTLTFPIDERFPQLTKFDFKQSFPRLSPDKSHTLVTIDVADDDLSFTDSYILKPFKYEILPMANEPPLELYNVDTSHFHPDFHFFKLRKISAAPNSPLNLMEDISGTYNIKYQYHILKREPFRLDTIALRDTTLTLTFPIDERFPQLTQFDFKQSYPRLSPDKSHALITIDVADDALSFTDSYILKPFKYEILPMANEPPLEIYDVDTSRFHPDYHFFKLKKLNAAPNSPLALMEDLSGTYTIKYQYHILKREPFRLDTIALRDTTLTLTFPIDERFPQLTKFDFKQSFPRLSPDKKHTLVEIELDDDLASYSPQYEIKPFSYQVLPKAQASPLQLLVLDTSDYDLHTFNLSINGTTPMDGLSGTYEILYKYHVLKREPFKLDTIALIDTSLTITFPLNTFNPSCDPVPCTPNTANLISSLPIDSIVKLCGGLTMKVLSVSASNNSQFTGTGEVYIPWLASKFNTTFTNIKVNASNELAVGDITVVRASGAPTYNSFASNVGISAIKKIAKWASTNSPIDIPSGAINAANNLQTSALKVPLGITKAAGNGKTGMTIAISDIKFSPSQNLLQAYAAISFGGGPNDTISFQSENFYFTSAGPIKNIGNANELKFPLFSDITVPYGSTNNNPLQLKFKKSGTFLNLTSACNEGLNWCMNVDMDIEMPRAWLLPKDDDGTGNMKAKASLKTDICDLNDILVAINLDTTIIAGTNGIKLSVNSLVWDNSTKKNTSNFTFPSTVNVDWKGFTLANANLTLPRDFIQNATNVSINLNNWVIDYKKGITGEVTKSNLITFPNLSLVDISGSIDSFKLIIKDNSITYGKIKGQLLLPLCNNENSTPAAGNLNYSATINSNGLNFSLTPNGGAMMDCPFFANGNLSILNTSSLRLILNNNKSEFNFTLNGKLDFPDKSIGPIKLSLDADFENIKFDYVKDKVNSNNNTVTFDEGDWNFASPQKLLNYFPFTIDEVRKEIRTNLSTGELYVGGVGFDLVANLNDNIGGEAGLAILGSINYSNGKLTAGFKGVEVDTVVVYANTNSVKLDGELIFQDTIINGNSIKAVKGSLAADFKCMNVGVSAGAVFGKVTGADPYRFFMVQAKALFTPGVPLFAGIALVGGGFGFYKNMEMVVNDSNLGLNGQASSSQVFAGASFTPEKGNWGIKVAAEIATTPSDAAFNGSLALEAGFDSNTGGLTHFEVAGSGYSGAGVLERTEAFLNANLTARYDFTNKIFDLAITANIKKPGIIVANNVSAKFHSDGLANEYYFHFGQPNDTLANSVRLFDAFDMKMYLMFGNSNINPPPGYFMQATRDGLNYVSSGSGNNSINPDYASGSNAGLVSLGKGFAAGLGVNANATGSMLNGRLGFNTTIGAEFNLSMLDYGTTSCSGYSPIGFNGYYLNTKLAAYVKGSMTWEKRNGVIDTLAELKASADIDAQFPDPYYFKASINGNIAFGGWDEGINIVVEKGTPCTPSSPVINNQIFTKENASDEIGDIFTDIYVDNNDNNYDPEKALQWKANFRPYESFSIPEQQSDGRVITRIFESRWNYTVSEQNTQGNFVPLSNNDFTLGIDENGRYYLNKNTIPKFGNPMFISASDGTKFDDEFSLVGRFEISGNIKAGDFDGNGVDDLLISKDNELYIMFNDGNMFYSPQKVLNSSLGNNVDSLHIADVNGDNKMDLILVDGTIMVYTAKNNGFVGVNFEFNQGVNWSDWSEGSDLNTNQCVFGDYNEDGKADMAFFHNLEGPNLLNTDTTNDDDGSPNKNVMYICFSEENKFSQPRNEFYRDNAPMAYNFEGNKQGYTYKNMNGFHSIVIFGNSMDYDSDHHSYSIGGKIEKGFDVNIALDSVKRTTTYIPDFYLGDFDKNPGDESISLVTGWWSDGGSLYWAYPEKYNHKFKIDGCPAIIGNFKNGASLLNTPSNSSNNSGNMRTKSTNLIIGKRYDDILEYNCTETSIKADPNIDIIYQNHLTPNKHYKLKLSGKIKDVTDSSFSQNPISIKDEEYEINFSTKDSEKIRALISENKKVVRYFPPGPGGIDSSMSPRPSLPNIGPGKSTSIINSPNSNKNKNN